MKTPPLGIADRIAKVRRTYTADQMVHLNRIATDQKTVAERQWQKGKLAPAPQQPCDVGLFSDDANQLDLLRRQSAI